MKKCHEVLKPSQTYIEIFNVSQTTCAAFDKKNTDSNLDTKHENWWFKILPKGDTQRQ